MKVPLLDLKAQHDPIQNEIEDAIRQVIQSQTFILGPEVQKLEERLAHYCQAPYALGVSSGTDALLIALMALDIGPGDEVITTAYSFFSTAGVIARLGAKPVFVDIDPETFNIHSDKIEKVVTSKTKAVIPVHLFGQVAEMDTLLDLARKHGFRVVEDLAQAIGAEYQNGQRAGGIGDIGCLSFYPTKNLGGMGDGGMVVTNFKDLNEKLRILRVHGSEPKYYHKLIGGNFRLDAIQAAILNVKMNYLDGWTKNRQTNAKRYKTLFRESGLLEKAEIRLPAVVYEDSAVSHAHIYNQYVIRVPERDRLRAHLKEQEIDTEIYYPVPFHLQECFRYLGYNEGDFPEAERAAKETLALPIYPELTQEQQEYVVQKIQTFFA
jgi:dTDP-4-amino-4,6-dideoxygalactose transaminase